MRRVRVANLAVDELMLDVSQSHYLLRVLRLPLGTEITAFNGEGHERTFRVASEVDGLAYVTASDAQRAVLAGPPVHLAIALLKGPAMDLAVRHATECGATAIHVITADRSVAKGDRAERWQRIAEAAARQSGRADLPDVHEPANFAAVLERLSGVPDRRLYHPGGDVLTAATGAVAVWVGPEGGWTPTELRQATDAGLVMASLARHILRADTAAGVGVALAAAPA